ncbi:MAG: translocation/assembly module TamB domain-containing protein [Myxococcota bacterium]|nr:translocation/assembly module TamB domain-containing protein [Myxococcota bacterium]
MARRIGIFLLALIAVLGLITGAVLVWATSQSGSQAISQKLRHQLRRDLGIDVSFDNIDFSILPPRIGISAIKAADEKNRIACSIDEAEFAPRPLDLVQGILSIEEVYVGSPNCQIRLSEAEVQQFTALQSKTSDADGKGKFDLDQLPDFDVFAISNGHLQIHIRDPNRVGDLNLDVDGFGLDVTGGEASIEVRVLIEAATGKWNKGEDRLAESLQTLRARFAIAQRAIEVRHLDAVVAGANIGVRNARIPMSFDERGPDVADLSIAVPLELFDRLPVDVPKMTGTAAFLGRLSMPKDETGALRVAAQGRVTLDDTSIDDFIVGGLKGEVSLSPQGVTFRGTEIVTAQGRLNLSGNIAFDEKLTTRLDAHLSGIELAHLLEQVKVPGAYVTQKMTGPVKLKGQLTPLRLDGTAQIEVADHTVLLDSFRAPKPEVALYIPRVSVKGPVTITDRYVAGQGLNVLAGATTVAVDMRMNYDETWRLLATSPDLHLDDLKEIVGFDVGGHGPVTCLITGLLSDPKITGSGAFEGFVFEGLAFKSASTDVHFQGTVLSFNDLIAKLAQSRASADELTLDFDAPGGLNVATRIKANRVAVEDLVSLFRIDTRPFGSPTGQLVGEVEINYAIDPEKLLLNADLTHNALTIFGESFGPDALRLSWDTGHLTVTEFGLPKGTGTISITGGILPDRSLKFIGVATGITSEAIDNPVFQKLGIQTTGQAFVIAEGSLDHPIGSANIRLGELRHAGVRYGSSTVTFRLNGAQITGRGKLAGDIATLEHAGLNLDTKEFGIEAFISSMNVLPILSVDTYEHRASLRLTGEAALNGRLDKKPDLTGHAAMNRVSMVFNKVSFEATRPLLVDVDQSQFRIQRTRFSGRDVVFDIGGTFGLERMNLKVSGLARLDQASDLVSGITRSQGTLQFAVKVRGKYPTPALSGEANLKDGSLNIEDFPYPIREIQGQVALNPQSIRFSGFTGNCAGGVLSGGGELRLSKGRISDYQFRMNMSDLELALLDDLTFRASTTKNGLMLNPSEKGSLPMITGDIEIRNLKYAQDIRVMELSDLNVERLSGKRTRPSRPKLIDENKDKFAFDIRLHGNRNLEARNNIFDMGLVIDDVEKPLRLVGTNQTFGFLGRVLGRRGHVRFAGKRFDIQYASIDFNDPLRPENPNFQVTADGQVRDWKITMTAEGTVDEYELKFASQPYLAKEDIVFVIFTGLTRAEHSQFGGTGMSLGAPILGQLGPSGGAIPLEVRVYNEYSEKAGAETTRVSIGRWVTPDVWVSFSSSVSQENDVEAELDYRINDEFSLSTGYENDNEGNVGNVGLDLKFRLEF